MDSFGDLLATVRKPAAKTPEVDELLSGEHAPKIRKFFDAVKWAEGGEPDLIVGGKQRFDPAKDHPNVVGLTTPEGPSTAAGDYQITGTNWYGKKGVPGLKQKIGAKDFTPENQLKAAITLFKERDGGRGLQALLNDDYDTALEIARKDWAALPGSKLHKGRNNTRKYEDFMSRARDGGFADLLKQIQPTEFDGLLESVRAETPATTPIDNYGAPAVEAQKQLEGAPVVQGDPVAKRLADYEAIQNIQPIMDRFPGSGRVIGTPLAPKQVQRRPTAQGGVDVSVGELTPQATPPETVSFDFDLHQVPKGMSAKKWVEDETAARLANKYNVPFETVLGILKKTPSMVKSGGEADEAYYEALRKDGFHGTTILESVIEDIKRAKPSTAKTKQMEETTTRYAEKYPEALKSLGEIEALAESGEIDPVKAKALIIEEKAAYDQWLQENPDVVGPTNEAYKGTYDRAAQGAIRQAQDAAQKAYKSKTADILKDYGSFKKYFSEKARIEKEYENRPLARPTEFAQNIGRYLLKIPATALKAAGMGADILSHEGIDPKDNPFFEAGKEWEARIDAAKNPDFRKELIVNDLAQGAGQLFAQAILVPFTGGASIALPITEGAVGGYEEAVNSGASHNHRTLAPIVAGLAAVPDALLKNKYLKGLRPAEKVSFIDNLTKSLFGNLAKEVGEVEARHLTRNAITSFIKKAPVGYFGERIQEGSERIINKALAKATYKPGMTTEAVLTPTADEARGEQAAGLVGILGSGVEVATNTAQARTESPSTILDEARTYKPSQAQKTEPDKPAVQTEAPVISERVSTPKGEGVVIEDRGNKVLVEFNDGQSVAEFRKNQITPVETSGEVEAKTPTIEAPNVREIDEKKPTTETPDVPTSTEKEVLAPSAEKAESPRTPARRMVIEPKDGGPAIYPESRKGVALKSVSGDANISEMRQPTDDDFKRWKKDNIVYRGADEVLGDEGDGGGMLGRGLYTTPSSNKQMSKQYGQVRLVADARPKNPKVFRDLNEWQIWAQNNLYPKDHKGRPDKREFNRTSTIEQAMLDLGYDGIEIKGREIVNFKPENEMYFENEAQARQYYESVVHPSLFSDTASLRKSDSNPSRSLKKARDAESTALLPKLQNEGTAKILSNLKGGKVADNGDFEINEHESEQIRRLLAEKHFQETGTEIDEKSFDAITWSAKQVRDLVELGRDLVTDFKRGGYTDAELKGYNTLLDNLEDSINKAKDYAAVFIFDDALPEEHVHQDDLRAGRTDSVAIAQLKENPLWKGGEKFNGEYSSVSDADRASEIGAKLITGQAEKYGWDKIDNFEAYKEAFLSSWLRGILRKNNIDTQAKLDEFKKTYSRIGQYASIQTDNQKGTGTQTGTSTSSESDAGPPAKGVRQDAEGKENLEAIDSEPEIAELTGQTEKQVVTKNRKFAESIANTFYDIGKVEYEPQTEQGWLKQSQKDIKELGAAGAIEKYDSLDPKSSAGYKTALGVAIASELYANGTTNQFADFGRQLTEDIGNIAQELRASALLSRLSPEHASLIAQAKVEKAIGRELTEEEFEKVDEKIQPAAKQLKIFSDDKDLSDSIIQDYERRISNYDKIIADMKSLLEQEKIKGNADLEKVKAEFEAYKTKKPKKKVEKIKEEVKANRGAYAQLFKDTFGSTILKSISSTGSISPSSEVLKSAATMRDHSPLNDPKVMEALVNLAAVKLSDGLKTGLTNEQFDEYLDGLTNNQLIQTEKDLIHAKAWDEIVDHRTLTPETRANLSNRAKHGRRAAKILNAEAIAEAQARRDERNAAAKAGKQAERTRFANKEAFRYDTYARVLVDTAHSINASPQSVFIAFGIREFGNEKSIRGEVKEQFPDLNPKDFNKAFLDAHNLLTLTKDNVLQAKIEAEAKKRNLSTADIEAERARNKDLAMRQRKARQNLEQMFNQLARTNTKKVLDFIEKVYNIPRALGFSSDAGFLGRQGGKALVMHSGAWWAAKGNAWSALTNKETLDKHLHDLYESEGRKLSEARGAKYKSIGEKSYAYEDWANSLFEEGLDRSKGGKIAKGAKAVGNFVTFIPRRSNMAHGAFLDEIRLKIFEEANTKLEAMNEKGKISDAQLKAAQEFFAQKYAPVVTGTAYGGQYDNVLNWASRIPLASARLRLSHFQFLYYLNPVRAAFLPKGARKIVYQKQLRFYAPVLSIIALGIMTGLMGDDPEESNFLKIKGDKLAEWTGFNGFKDMEIDVSGGAKEAWRTAVLGAESLAYSIFGGDKEKQEAINNELIKMYVMRSIYKDDKYYGKGVGTYWRYGMHPGLSIVDSLIEEQDAIGKPYGLKQAVRDILVPLPLRQVAENATYKEDKTLQDTAVRLFFSTLLEEGGAGVQSFKKFAKKEKGTADKVRSGDMSVSDAKTELENQYRDGKITRKTYKTRIKDLENDTFEKALKKMNAAKDDDFTKIEAFLKEVPDSRMEDARKILRQKRANKLKDNSPKAKEDARKLQELMVKYLKFKS